MTMYSREELITPEIAREYLTHNKKNRNLRPRRVQEYAREIKAGKWAKSPESIAFYENGDLANGQHRLSAVVEADTPAVFYVTYDVPNDCKIFDRGASRTSADTMKLNDVSAPISTTNGDALINFLFSPYGNVRVSDSTKIDFANKYNDTLVDALSITNSSKKGNLCRKSPITAALFCALYCGLPMDGLKRFVTVVNEGFPETIEESAAIVLRNYILQTYTGSSQSERKFLFTVATNAIRDFANKNVRKRIYASNTKPAFYDYVKKTALNHYMVGCKNV